MVNWTGVGIDWLILMLRKLNLFHSTVLKMDRTVFDKTSSFKMLALFFSSKFYWGSYIFCVTETSSQKIGALICSNKFLLRRSLFISINLLSGLAWSTIIITGWCSNRHLDMLDKPQKWIYRNVGLHLLVFLNPQLIVESSQFKYFL